ncbi:MAG: NIPSNAP family protein [Tannerella sp.]|jgi:hypothetical protein|nr:NIPSNAP family protein [Tannerella sp.]
MKRRNFMKAAGALSMVPAMGMASSLKGYTVSSGAKEIYEWRIYTLTGDGNVLDSFLKDVLIPACNRKNIKAGAFRLYKDGEKEQRHVLFIYPDIEAFLMMKKTIWEDAVFRRESDAFYRLTASDPVYSNFESYLSEAFDKIPAHRLPDPSRTLFEIRIYHSPNEEANLRKVRMFNKEEIDLFDKVAINSVLYGNILAGPRMPALLYLTWYHDEETRSEAWKKFVSHPEWKRMSSLPEYANTATNNQSIFLSPMPYSQL